MTHGTGVVAWSTLAVAADSFLQCCIKCEKIWTHICSLKYAVNTLVQFSADLRQKETYSDSEHQCPHEHDGLEQKSAMKESSDS